MLITNYRFGMNFCLRSCLMSSQHLLVWIGNIGNLRPSMLVVRSISFCTDDLLFRFCIYFQYSVASGMLAIRLKLS
jgi:hypothetical protein